MGTTLPYLQPENNRPRSPGALYERMPILTLLLAGLTLSVVSCRKYPEVYVNPDDYSNVVDNQYFPLVPGTVLTYAETPADTTSVFRVTSLTDTVLGVVCCVAVETTYRRDGSVSWTGTNSYAQHKDGDVCKFAWRYTLGNVVDSWEAGKYGEKPGIVMGSSPQVGEYYTWPGDRPAVVVSTTETVSVPCGEFANCVEIRIPGEPAHRCFYAPGVGYVLYTDDSHVVEEELVGIERP